jgi:hypothetical protein
VFYSGTAVTGLWAGIYPWIIEGMYCKYISRIFGRFADCKAEFTTLVTAQGGRVHSARDYTISVYTAHLILYHRELEDQYKVVFVRLLLEPAENLQGGVCSSPPSPPHACTRARIFKRSWGQGMDSKSSIPPAYVAWRAGTITLFLLGAWPP